jgi:luciferase family oxidoreductase group 1
MVPFSVLDLAPVTSDVAAALRNTLELARHVERLGYQRFWLAEHHGMPGIASAATSVVIAHVAAGTERIRVGAGGIMLPNHAPLLIAEQFGTLAALHPGRIDLGVGRAPGTDQVTLRALRRDPGDADRFPDDVLELLGLFRPAQPGQTVRAVPGAGELVPVWILGSSLFGAQLAAEIGLPYAFASHFAPAALLSAIALYRARFRPSKYLAEPYVMLGVNAIVAEQDDEALLLATSLKQAFVNLRRGQLGLLPAPDAALDERLTEHDRALIEHTLSCAVIGSVDTVTAGLRALLERTHADELMFTSQIFDHRARLRSFELLAEARAALQRQGPGK